MPDPQPTAPIGHPPARQQRIVSNITHMTHWRAGQTKPTQSDQARKRIRATATQCLPGLRSSRTITSQRHCAGGGDADTPTSRPATGQPESPRAAGPRGGAGPPVSTAPFARPSITIAPRAPARQVVRPPLRCAPGRALHLAHRHPPRERASRPTEGTRRHHPSATAVSPHHRRRPPRPPAAGAPAGRAGRRPPPPPPQPPDPPPPPQPPPRPRPPRSRWSRAGRRPTPRRSPRRQRRAKGNPKAPVDQQKQRETR